MRAKFRNDLTHGSKVISFFVFHRKCIESVQQFGVLAILGVKTEISIFLTPKGNSLAETRVLTYHSPKSVHRFDQGTMPRNKKIMVSAAILDFHFFSMQHFRGSGLDSACMINFVVI